MSNDLFLLLFTDKDRVYANIKVHKSLQYGQLSGGGEEGRPDPGWRFLPAAYTVLRISHHVSRRPHQERKTYIKKVKQYTAISIPNCITDKNESF